ncbi:lipopolysaccharide biosynthesis protein [Mucilaginibacter myungsuensis]|uniref:Oligosaccharide flippase family protein n=1 Tax=Mucilaginibacter myungsuensis TaxID=649104 RepID=A0A929L059_9SPHI|nr:oligosaccharide flippase family protein [Mucilaginibacter myungsuensis]MBE9662069.1 oligosaccharide flippase family protein [Mucilaginibacter myungsuensis]MDN3599497.1 oligosaccharide flippase family protein [Mucilaginibacter myungsuensis]
MGKIKELIGNKQFLSLAGNVVMAGLNLITNAILLRHTTEERMGDWFFFQATYVFIDTFRSGFLSTAFIKFFAGADKQRADNVLGSTWVLGWLITLAICVITVPGLFMLKYIDNSGIETAIKWVAITFVATLPIVVATWILQAQQRYKEILYIRLINQGSFIIAVIVLIYIKQNTLYWYLVTNIISCVLTSVIVFACSWTGMKTMRAQTKASMTEIYHFGKFSVGTSISANLLRYSDTFIINLLLVPTHPNALAVYGIGQMLTNMIDIPLRSFVNTGMSSLSAAQNNNRKDELQYIFKKYTGALTILFVPVIIGAMAFADIAVGMLGGGKYVGTPAANIFRIFLCIALLFPIDRFTGVTLDIIHKPKINFYKVLAMLSVNIVGDLIGIHLLHSIYGVGFASIPTFIVGTAIGYFSLKMYMDFTFTDIIKLGWAEVKILYKLAMGKLAR